MGRRLAILGCIVTLSAILACSPVETRSGLDRPTGVSFASAGDLLLRVNRQDDLPNAFGRADLFGRTRDRGYTEIRYMGLNANGNPTFRRRDVEIATNETTMSRSGGFSTYSAQASGKRTGTAASASYAATGATFIPAQAQVIPLPPDTIEIVLDLRDGRTLTIGQHGAEILEATSAGVRYRVF